MVVFLKCPCLLILRWQLSKGCSFIDTRLIYPEKMFVGNIVFLSNVLLWRSGIKDNYIHVYDKIVCLYAIFIFT